MVDEVPKKPPSMWIPESDPYVAGIICDLGEE
jgi:hypothetical protein